MTKNFGFLKEIDTKLYKLIDEAESLYRDEYFDQCMIQTRRFGENVCKNVLGDYRTVESTFDDMLATLKDKVTGEIQEKEFIDDLYFLKKNGNTSAHSLNVKKDAITALECLQRAFEVALSYAVYHQCANSSLLKLRYDTELMITGKKSRKNLKEKFEEQKKIEKKSSAKKSKTKAEKKSPVTKKKRQSQSHTMTSKKSRKGISPFWIVVGISTVFSFVLLAGLFFASLK